MFIRFLLLLLGCVAGQLSSCPASWAQQPTPAPTDVLLLTSGQEVSGRVLTITPAELTYLPAAPAGASTDTLRLPVTQVFMVRYANGTREVISSLAAPQAPDTTPPALRELSGEQRLALGRQDASHYYRASGPYWGTLGATLYLGPLLGLAPAAGISSAAVHPQNLAVPQPDLLADQHYAEGYKQQANKIKRRRTWSGYFVGTAAYVLLIAALLAGGE